jgi:hypothetical protein
MRLASKSLRVALASTLGCGGLAESVPLDAQVEVRDDASIVHADARPPIAEPDGAGVSDASEAEAAESDADFEHLVCGSVVCEARTQGCCIPRGVAVTTSCVPRAGPCDGVLVVCDVIVDTNGRHARCDAR